MLKPQARVKISRLLRISLGMLLLNLIMVGGVQAQTATASSVSSSKPSQNQSISASPAAAAQSPGPLAASPLSEAVLATPAPEAEVTYLGEPLFKIYADSAIYSAAERAEIISRRIDSFAHQLDSELPKVQLKGNLAYINSGQVTLMTVTEEDAAAARLSVSQLAEFYTHKLSEAIHRGQLHYNFIGLLLNALLALAITGFLILLITLLRRGLPPAQAWVEKQRQAWLPELRVRGLVLVSEEQLGAMFSGGLRLLRNLTVLLLLYFYFPLVLSLFPWTRTLSGTLLSYLITPLTRGWQAFVNYVPNLFVIALVAVLVHYALKLVHLVFKALESDVISYPGFHREWAQPTYSIMRFLILAFAAVVIFPYLPGSDSEAFKGVSLFLGILFSLGSTSAISNMVAGVVLTYMRSFRVGDRVKIADAVGDVFEKNLLVTRIRTPKNEIVTVPNSAVLGSHIINYSSDEVQTLILHTTVTIGYDVPWPKVQQLLLAAAAATPDLLDAPAPFVLQTSLDDFYVSYQLNAHTNQPHQMPRIYSDLHQQILDQFHAAGVEILSPHFRALRDGNQANMPELPPDYQTPSFRVQQSS